jgi:hypothetical protein
LTKYQIKTQVKAVDVTINYSDGTLTVSGLSDAMAGEILQSAFGVSVAVTCPTTYASTRQDPDAFTGAVAASLTTTTGEGVATADDDDRAEPEEKPPKSKKGRRSSTRAKKKKTEEEDREKPPLVKPDLGQLPTGDAVEHEAPDVSDLFDSDDMSEVVENEGVLTSDVVESLVKIDRVKDVLIAMRDAGCDTEDKLISEAIRIQDDVPTMAAFGEKWSSKIKRAAAMIMRH